GRSGRAKPCAPRAPSGYPRARSSSSAIRTAGSRSCRPGAEPASIRFAPPSPSGFGPRIGPHPRPGSTSATISSPTSSRCCAQPPRRCSCCRPAAPPLLGVPPPDDVPPAHAAVPCLAAEALARAVAAGAAQPTILGYIVHNPGWPPASPERPAPMPLPPEGSVRGTWVSVALAPADLTAKTAALRAHASQLAASGEFLQRFLRTTEPLVRAPTRWPPTAPPRSHADRP